MVVLGSKEGAHLRIVQKAVKRGKDSVLGHYGGWERTVGIRREKGE